MPGYRGPEGAIPISALVSQAAAPTGQDVLIDPKTEQAVRLSASASVILTLVTNSAEQTHQHLSQVEDPEKISADEKTDVEEKVAEALDEKFEKHNKKAEKPMDEDEGSID